MGKGRIRVPEDMKQHGSKASASVSSTRPLRFLFTSAIIIAIALYKNASTAVLVAKKKNKLSSILQRCHREKSKRRPEHRPNQCRGA